MPGGCSAQKKPIKKMVDFLKICKSSAINLFYNLPKISEEGEVICPWKVSCCLRFLST